MDGSANPVAEGFDHVRLEGRRFCADHGLPAAGFDKPTKASSMVYHPPSFLFFCGGVNKHGVAQSKII